jgi:hypothetical protein
MSPVSRCLREFDNLSCLTDSTVAGRLEAVLDELEVAYLGPHQRLLAFDALLRQFRRLRHLQETPFGRFVRARIESRRDNLAA